MASPSRDEFVAQLRGSAKVDFLSFVHGNVLVMSKNVPFVEALEKKGAHVRWFDRTEFSTRAGKSEALMQAEVILGPSFFGEEQA